MSLAAATREAVRNRPVLYDALRAGVVNYTAAADSLELDGDREAIATALRRFAAELADDDPPTEGGGGRSITVRLHSEFDSIAAPDTLLAVEGRGFGSRRDDPGDETPTDTADPDDTDVGRQTAVRVTGDVDAHLLSATLARLRIADIPVAGAGVTSEALVVIVPRRDGPTAIQLVESVAETE